MVSANVHLGADMRLSSEPRRVERGRVLGYLTVRTDEGEARIAGTPERMRVLAAEAERAAGQAENLLRIEALLADAGNGDRPSRASELPGVSGS
jgi:hypothetical protein